MLGSGMFAPLLALAALAGPRAVSASANVRRSIEIQPHGMQTEREEVQIAPSSLMELSAAGRWLRKETVEDSASLLQQDPNATGGDAGGNATGGAGGNATADAAPSPGPPAPATAAGCATFSCPVGFYSKDPKPEGGSPTKVNCCYEIPACATVVCPTGFYKKRDLPIGGGTFHETGELATVDRDFCCWKITTVPPPPRAISTATSAPSDAGGATGNSTGGDAGGATGNSTGGDAGGNATLLARG